MKLHQRDDRSFAVIVRHASTSAELARALVGGGDRAILEDEYLAFVMPHARIVFEDHDRYRRFKKLVLVRRVTDGYQSVFLSTVAIAASGAHVFFLPL